VLGTGRLDIGARTAPASTPAAQRSSERVWEAITAIRSREVPSGTVGG